MEYQDFLDNMSTGEDEFKEKVFRRYSLYLEDLSLRPYQAELIKLRRILKRLRRR